MTKPRTPRRRQPPKQGIRSLAVQGFKSIGDEQRVDIRPLTVLAGANSAGKSSILQPLLLLKQTLESAYDPGPLLLHGPCVRFTSADQFLSHRIGAQASKTFMLELVSMSGAIVSIRYRRAKDKRLEIESMAFAEEDNPDFFTMSANMTDSELQKSLPPELQGLADTVGKQFHGDYQWSVVRDRCFLALELLDKKKNDRINFLGGKNHTPAEHFIPNLLNVLHVPGLRGNPERSYRTTAIENYFPGTFEPYIASILNHWQHQKDDRLAKLGQDLQTLGLTWKVSALPIDETQVEIHVGRLPKAAQGGARDLVNIADVGFGLSQTLPVVVALRLAEKGRLVYIEQPEIHLHPRAQAAMGALLIAAANRGVRVVVETHSSVLLRAIQTAVAHGEINPDDVGLNWFERNPKTGMTTVQPADLDSNGAFGDWPEDFDDVTLDVESAYLDAVEKRLAG